MKMELIKWLRRRPEARRDSALEKEIYCWKAQTPRPLQAACNDGHASGGPPDGGKQVLAAVVGAPPAREGKSLVVWWEVQRERGSRGSGLNLAALLETQVSCYLLCACYIALGLPCPRRNFSLPLWNVENNFEYVCAELLFRTRNTYGEIGVCKWIYMEAIVRL